MFIRDTTKTIFEVMYDFDIADDQEQRAKDLRNAVSYYNEYSGMNHVLNSKLINLYFTWCNNI